MKQGYPYWTHPSLSEILSSYLKSFVVSLTEFAQKPQCASVTPGARTAARGHRRVVTGRRWEEAFTQLTYNALIKYFLSFLSPLGRLAHPIPCSSWNFPGLAHGLLWDEGMESHQRPQGQRSGKAQYRRRARSPGPGASRTPSSRLSPPGPGRARRRSGAPAVPRASARGPWACTGPHSRSRGSTPPRCTGELKNSTTGRTPEQTQRLPGRSRQRTQSSSARVHCAWTRPWIRGNTPS